MHPLLLLTLSSLPFLMIGCLHRGSGPAVEDLPYLPNVSARQQANLYLPDGSGPHPVAVVIHGGGWTGSWPTKILCCYATP